MVRDEPRVSIGLPVFNGEKYLAEALESLLAQTFSDFELIISDNASTDGTEAICKEYASKDYRIRYYKSRKNIGAVGNFNRAFSLSNAEYFKWAAHDDLCARDYLKQCLEVLDHEPSVVLCYPKTTIIDEKGRKMYNHEDGLNLRSSVPHKRFRQFLRKPPGCNPLNGLMRRKVLCRTQLIRPYDAADYILLAEMCLRGKFWEVPERLFYRRNHPQMSRRLTSSNRDYALWFDTSYRGKNAFPVLNVLFQLMRTISFSPISHYEKALCFGEIIKSTFILSSRALKWISARADQSRMY